MLGSVLLMVPVSLLVSRHGLSRRKAGTNTLKVHSKTNKAELGAVTMGGGGATWTIVTNILVRQ